MFKNCFITYLINNNNKNPCIKVTGCLCVSVCNKSCIYMVLLYSEGLQLFWWRVPPPFSRDLKEITIPPKFYLKTVSLEGGLPPPSSSSKPYKSKDLIKKGYRSKRSSCHQVLFLYPCLLTINLKIIEIWQHISFNNS